MVGCGVDIRGERDKKQRGKSKPSAEENQEIMSQMK